MFVDLGPLYAAFPAGYDASWWLDPTDRAVADMFGSIRLLDCQGYAVTIRHLHIRRSLTDAEYAERRAELLPRIRMWRRALRALDMLERKAAISRSEREQHRLRRMAEHGFLPTTLCSGSA